MNNQSNDRKDQNQGQSQNSGNANQSQNSSTPNQSQQDSSSSPANEDSRTQQGAGTQKDGSQQQKPAETETGTEKTNVDPQQTPEKKY